MYAEGGHHPQEELAKFGHRSERKVENFKNPLYVWPLAGTYCLNRIQIAFSQNLATLVHLRKKILCQICNGFFLCQYSFFHGVNFCLISRQRNTD
jgi:hypothetical protein